jgi:hypothetical protein
MNNHVEIEFAVNLDTPDGEPKDFSFLQIRPIVESSEKFNVNIDFISRDETIIYSTSTMGNGFIKNLKDVIYVKPESFNAAKNPLIATKLEELNKIMINEEKNYILIGPGRWGSSDPWLGIPVKWSQISAARVMVEAGLEKYRIDPSQGTHFFQNLTSFGIGYFTVNSFINEGFYDTEYLSSVPAVYEDEYIRHVRFEKPLIIKIDGKQNKGVIMKGKS